MCGFCSSYVISISATCWSAWSIALCPLWPPPWFGVSICALLALGRNHRMSAILAVIANLLQISWGSGGVGGQDCLILFWWTLSTPFSISLVCRSGTLLVEGYWRLHTKHLVPVAVTLEVACCLHSLFCLFFFFWCAFGVFCIFWGVTPRVMLLFSLAIFNSVHQGVIVEGVLPGGLSYCFVFEIR